MITDQRRGATPKYYHHNAVQAHVTAVAWIAFVVGALLGASITAGILL